jgi:YVTN family beta-propeller protein
MQPFAYVTNTSSNNVTVIDIATQTVRGQPIQVGTTPVAIAITPDGSRVYVANNSPSDNSVTVIDTAANTTTTIRDNVVRRPAGVAVTLDGKRVYVWSSEALSSGTQNEFSVVDTTSNQAQLVPAPPQVEWVAFMGPRAYVTASFNTVTVINTNNNTVESTITVGNDVGAAAISPDGKQIYVTSGGARDVSVIDIAQAQVVATVNVNNPTGIVIAPDGKRVFVRNSPFASTSNSEVSVIDTTASPMVVRSVTSVGVLANRLARFGLAVTADGTHVYATSDSTDTVFVIDMTNNQAVTRIPVGPEGHGPTSVAIAPPPG